VAKRVLGGEQLLGVGVGEAAEILAQIHNRLIDDIGAGMLQLPLDGGGQLAQLGAEVAFDKALPLRVELEGDGLGFDKRLVGGPFHLLAGRNYRLERAERRVPGLVGGLDGAVFRLDLLLKGRERGGARVAIVDFVVELVEEDGYFRGSARWPWCIPP
jgi:hypothetical protein